MRRICLPLLLIVTAAAQADSPKPGNWVGTLNYPDIGASPIELRITDDALTLLYGDGRESGAERITVKKGFGFEVDLYGDRYRCRLKAKDKGRYRGTCKAVDGDDELRIRLENNAGEAGESPDRDEEPESSSDKPKDNPPAAAGNKPEPTTTDDAESAEKAD